MFHPPPPSPLSLSPPELRSLTASSQEEKDYFQVTDDLAKENSHFALSEALLTVVEQVRERHDTSAL